MKIVTSIYNKEFSQILNASFAQNKKVGYTPYVYYLNEEVERTIEGEYLDCESYYAAIKDRVTQIINEKIPLDLSGYYSLKEKKKRFNSKGTIPAKPFIIKNALEKSDKFLVWMDADAFAIQNFNEITNDEFDIGITVRERSEKCSNKMYSGYINAGIIFFQNNERTKNFVEKWMKEIPNGIYFSDQEALNRTILKVFPNYDFYAVDKITQNSEIKIKNFSTKIYNYYYEEEPNFNVKILHAKGSEKLKEQDFYKKWFITNWQEKIFSGWSAQ